MTKTRDELKMHLLGERQKALFDQLEAQNKSYIVNLDEADKVKIKISMDNIEVELDKIEAELARLTDHATQPATTDNLIVRVAVVAMKAEQADVLDTGGPFANPLDYKQYDDLRSALHAHGIAQLKQYYGSRPNDWSPFVGAAGPTITTVIDELVKRLNDENEKKAGWRRIEVQDLSSKCLSEDPDEQTRYWGMLEQQGGIVVVDAVSLHHPDVRQCLVNAQVMGKNSKAAMIVLSPLKADALPVNNLLRTRMYQAHLLRALDHFQVALNPLWEFDINNPYNLRRWLYATLPKMKIDGLPPETRQHIEDQYPPQGIENKVTGGKTS